MNKISDLWGTLSHKVLASVLVDSGSVFPVHDIIGYHWQWFPPNDQPIWQAVIHCLEVNTPPTVEAVILYTGDKVAPGYIRTIAGLFNDADNRKLRYNVEQLKQLGVLAQLQQYGRELTELDTIEDLGETVDKITTEVGGIMAQASNRESSAASVSDIAWRQVEQYREIGISTGFDWFDDLTGGLWRGMNYWIAAPYKSGKSTVMRNAVLQAARLNNPVGVFCAEGSREMFTLDCQAMLATMLLLEAGLTGNQLRLSGLMIKRFYWQNGVLNNRELEAIHEAREIWRGLPIHLWDTTDGIRSLSTLRYLVKRGRVHHGVTSVWGDYSQLFGSGSTLFERQSTTALMVQDIAQHENVAFCMLAQKSEEGIKSEASYSPNVKGGGDAAAAADFLLVPGIDRDTPNLLHFELKLSRHTRTGKGDHLLAPSSGLVLDKVRVNGH